MKTICTTLNALRRHHPCKPGWDRLLRGLGKTRSDDESLTLVRILEINGLDDALWCLQALPSEHNRRIRQLAVRFARDVQHLMTDPRSINALDVAERYANGLVTEKELKTAWAADVEIHAKQIAHFIRFCSGEE